MSIEKMNDNFKNQQVEITGSLVSLPILNTSEDFIRLPIASNHKIHLVGKNTTLNFEKITFIKLRYCEIKSLFHLICTYLETNAKFIIKGKIIECCENSVYIDVSSFEGKIAWFVHFGKKLVVRNPKISLKENDIQAIVKHDNGEIGLLPLE